MNRLPATVEVLFSFSSCVAVSRWLLLHDFKLVYCMQRYTNVSLINKSKLAVEATAKCSDFNKASPDMDLNSLGGREVDKLVPKKTSEKDQFDHDTHYGVVRFQVSMNNWAWSVCWLWSGLWAAQALAERTRTALLGTARCSWPAAQADGQQQNSPISIWSGLNQMPGGHLSVERP